MQNSIRISEELLDSMVDALTQLPYRDVTHIFQRLSAELGPAEPEQESKIIV